MIFVTFLGFPDTDKAHWASTIGDFFTSFVNVRLSRILSIPKEIDYISNLYANNLRKPKHHFVDSHEDRRSTTIVFVWFVYLLEFFSTLNLSSLGAVFSC
jgi:hypothetical protein